MPRVGGADERQALLDGPQAGLGEVLVGPGVRPNQASLVTFRIRLGPRAVGQHRAREDRLVADRRRDRRQAGDGEGPRAVARLEAARDVDELAQADRRGSARRGAPGRYSPKGTRWTLS